MNTGLTQAKRQAIPNPVPPSWSGRADAPLLPPAWASIGKLSNVQLKNLQSQIAYDQSKWDYSKIGEGNALGRYQFTPVVLEDLGLLAVGSNEQYGIDCVNRKTCWRPVNFNNVINVYQNFFYDVKNINDFLNNTTAQEHLAYQYIASLHTGLRQIDAITDDDTSDIVAGMIYVAWTLGVGSKVNKTAAGGGAWAWRYYNRGNGTDSYNSGRYAVTSLTE